MAHEAHAEGVRHHYMRNLRFDSEWAYQAYSRTGRSYWARLDLGSTDSQSVESDPEGVQWCARRCASVLGQRPVSFARLRRTPIETSDPVSVVMALRQLLPKHEVEIRHTVDATACRDVASIIASGGGVLARLERQHPIRRIPPGWVWVVGVELEPLSHGVEAEQTPAFLLVGPELGPLWASGYGAKATLTDVGTWRIRSVDGHAWAGTFGSMILWVPQ